MLRLNRILVARDRSTCSKHALDHALWLAALSGAELYVLHVDVLLGPAVIEPEDLAGETAEIHARLREIEDEVRVSGGSARFASQVRVVDVVERGLAPAAAINLFAADYDVDVIIVGTHGRKGLRRLLMGSVAEELVRTAPCPVLTVHAADGQPARRPRSILVPVDFSTHSAQALKYAADCATIYGAELRLVHVIEELAQPSFLSVGLLSPFDMLPEIEHATDVELRRFAQEVIGVRTGLRVQTFTGRPAAAIVGYVAQNYVDLIVMPTRGLTGLEHLVLGSVAERVVRHAPCPVLTVRPNLYSGADLPLQEGDPSNLTLTHGPLHV